MFKNIYHQKNLQTGLITGEEQEALEALQSLLQEQVANNSIQVPSSLVPPSIKFSPLSMYVIIDLFIKLVSSEFSKIETRVPCDNCAWSERKAIKELKAMHDNHKTIGEVWKHGQSIQGGNI